MYNVTLIPGDGIGPEVVYAAKRLIEHLELRLIGKCRKQEET